MEILPKGTTTLQSRMGSLGLDTVEGPRQQNGGIKNKLLFHGLEFCCSVNLYYQVTAMSVHSCTLYT